MHAALQRFGQTLRRAGLRLSSAELLDGLRACEALGLRDPETLRSALAATLVKRREDRPLFDELFDLRHRWRARRKPRLVVLCDISDSVRNVSRFMLQST